MWWQLDCSPLFHSLVQRVADVDEGTREVDAVKYDEVQTQLLQPRGKKEENMKCVCMCVCGKKRWVGGGWRWKPYVCNDYNQRFISLLFIFSL